MRAPFYICLEIFNPIEAFPEVIRENYLNKIHRPITLKVQFDNIQQNMYSESVMPRKYDE